MPERYDLLILGSGSTAFAAAIIVSLLTKDVGAVDHFMHMAHDRDDVESDGRLALWGGGINTQGTLPLGTPEEVAAHGASYTGRFLKPVLEGRAATVNPEAV